MNFVVDDVCVVVVDFVDDEEDDVNGDSVADFELHVHALAPGFSTADLTL